MIETGVIELHYLPSLEYFCCLLRFEKIHLEVNDHFIKQTYRNRCFINTAQGKKMLTVPLMERHGKILTKDVLIDTAVRWRNNHWRTIESAYRKAPYFEYYSDELKKILFRGHEHLFELNMDLLSFCLRHIGFQKNISATVAYTKIPVDNSCDLRSVISSKTTYTERNFYLPKKYYQVFGNEFVENLSLIDLLFCEGPRANEMIKISSHFLNK